MQIYWSRHIFSRSCVTNHSIVEKRIQVIIPLRMFEKFPPKVQTEALTRQDNFICVPFLQFRGQILLILNANSEFAWNTADTVLVYKLFVFHSSWILGQYERSIVLTFTLRASSVSCHDKMILFRILRFFGVEESIWSGITNPFSDSPEETHPKTSLLFLVHSCALEVPCLRELLTAVCICLAMWFCHFFTESGYLGTICYIDS